VVVHATLLNGVYFERLSLTVRTIKLEYKLSFRVETCLKTKARIKLYLLHFRFFSF